MNGTLEKSVSSWQAERDGLLDQISYLQDASARASNFLLKLCEVHGPEVQFDITEALMILNETRVDSDARRFGETTDDLIASDLTTKEVA